MSLRQMLILLFVSLANLIIGYELGLNDHKQITSTHFNKTDILVCQKTEISYFSNKFQRDDPFERMTNDSEDEYTEMLRSGPHFRIELLF